MGENQDGGRGFFDALGRLFVPGRSRDDGRGKVVVNDFAATQGAFNQALQRLNAKIELLRREGETNADSPVLTAGAAEDRLRRMARQQAAMRDDILSWHRQLGTGIDDAELARLATFMQATGKQVAAGEAALEVQPRCRRSILLRLQKEAGELAWSELERLCAAAGASWPETLRRDPLDSPETFERLRRDKRQENRAAFIDDDVLRSGQLLLGIESAWQSDYPERGTPPWQQLALDGVASALRARLLEGYFARVLSLRDAILARAVAQVGPELEALNRTVGAGVVTLEDAHRVAASSYRILDEIIPAIAWEMINTDPGTPSA